MFHTKKPAILKELYELTPEDMIEREKTEHNIFVFFYNLFSIFSFIFNFTWTFIVIVPFYFVFYIVIFSMLGITENHWITLTFIIGSTFLTQMVIHHEHPFNSF